MEKEHQKNPRKIYFFNYGSDNLHELYKELINNPPEGYEYNHKPLKLSVNDIGSLKKINTLHSLYSSFLNRLITPNSIMKIAYRFKKIPSKFDFIHSGETIFLQKKPWVITLQSANALAGHNIHMLRKNKKNIEKAFNSEYCKKIMPFTEAAKKTLETSFNTTKFKHKIEVVHFATKIRSVKVNRKDKSIKLLYVGSKRLNNSNNFYIKGGAEMVEAFKILNKKYPYLKLIIVAYVPNEIKSELEKIGNFKIINNIPREELSEIYSQCDIYLYPTFLMPGLAVVEAMGSGLPIITTDIPGNSELVENGKNGFVINCPYRDVYAKGESVSIKNFNQFIQRMRKENGNILIKGIVQKISELIDKPTLRKKMGNYSREKYLREFSIESRNKQLKKIFDKIQ